MYQLKVWIEGGEERGGHHTATNIGPNEGLTQPLLWWIANSKANELFLPFWKNINIYSMIWSNTSKVRKNTMQTVVTVWKVLMFFFLVFGQHTYFFCPVKNLLIAYIKQHPYHLVRAIRKTISLKGAKQHATLPLIKPQRFILAIKNSIHITSSLIICTCRGLIS